MIALDLTPRRQLDLAIERVLRAARVYADMAAGAPPDEVRESNLTMLQARAEMCLAAKALREAEKKAGVVT